MSKRILCSCSVVLSVLLASSTPLSAQTTGDQVLYACYIPLVGVVYRIKAPGLPTACLAKTHVEFQWNVQGLRGERGEPGAPGNLALAGLSCQPGYFVAGFSSVGTLICRSLTGEETPPTPIPPVPNAMEGIWALNPSLTLRCTSTWGSATFTAIAMRTVLQPSGHLFGNLNGMITIPPGLTIQTTLATTDLGMLPTPLAFPLTSSASGGALINIAPLTGSLEYNVSGTFASAALFTGSLDLSASNMQAHVEITPGVPTTINLSCAAVSANFTATK